RRPPRTVPRMSFSPGFAGRGRTGERRLPPGQHLADDFPVLSIGPTPRVDRDRWEFVITDEVGRDRVWTGAELLALPAEDVTVDIHCVTAWSKLDTRWRGVS